MENLIEELTKVNPENLSEEGLKLFNKIMEIIDRNEELEKENRNLNIIRLEYLVSQFPDTTETYKKYKKELNELLQEGDK